MRINTEKPSFVAFDFETVNNKRHSACALGLTEVIDGEIESFKSWLFRPSEMDFNPFCMKIHGITPDMVEKKPNFAEIWPEVESAIKGKTLVAHNLPFDRSVLKNTCEFYNLKPISSESYCTLQLCRKSFPQLPNHRLNTICAYLGIPLKHHDAISDSAACAEILLHCSREGLFNSDLYYSAVDLSKECKEKEVVLGSCCGEVIDFPKKSLYAGSVREFDFTDKEFVITGVFTNISRKEAQSVIAKSGGHMAKGSVTQKTDYLVVGEQGSSAWKNGNYGTKIEKALGMISKGHHVRIIPETLFLFLSPKN